MVIPRSRSSGALSMLSKARKLAFAAQSHRFGDRGGQGGFAVVNVADSADVDVRFSSLELLLCHLLFSSLDTERHWL